MRAIPPPLWMLGLLAATYGLGFAPGFARLPLLPTQPIGAAIMLTAGAILLTAMLQFRRADTQLMPNSEKNNALVTNGIFALTRNPMYLAMTLFSLGGALWFGRMPMLLAPVLMFAVANWAFIPFEEAKMARQFGADFDAYLKRVRRWL